MKVFYRIQFSEIQDSPRQNLCIHCCRLHLSLHVLSRDLPGTTGSKKGERTNVKSSYWRLTRPLRCKTLFLLDQPEVKTGRVVSYWMLRNRVTHVNGALYFGFHNPKVQRNRRHSTPHKRLFWGRWESLKGLWTP